MKFFPFAKINPRRPGADSGRRGDDLETGDQVVSIELFRIPDFAGMIQDEK
ncbi:MAG: hypothetical protein GY866_40995 [Proteobacteria bacterium]|nr:hypothetical protein [Pseudomonadota bacterium]